MYYDVTAMGELLVDFTQNGVTDQGNGLFEANPGGAPCNVLAMLEKLGKKTAFIGKVGDDLFGHLLAEVVAQAGIDIGGLEIDKSCLTTLAFVQNTPDGDRKFSFFRKPGADQLIKSSEIRKDIIQSSRIFHFGTLSLTDEPARSATHTAVAIAKSAGVCISFDPNLRPRLWSSLEAAKEHMEWGCGQCRILKLAEDELVFLTDKYAVSDGVLSLRQKYPNISLILVTKGKEGSEAFFNDIHVSVPSYLEVKTIDTTGAGDTFLGSCLSYVLDHNLDTLTEQQIIDMLKIANAAASLVTAKKGAIRSMPSYEEILQLIQTE